MQNEFYYYALSFYQNTDYYDCEDGQEYEIEESDLYTSLEYCEEDAKKKCDEYNKDSWHFHKLYYHIYKKRVIR